MDSSTLFLERFGDGEDMGWMDVFFGSNDDDPISTKNKYIDIRPQKFNINTKHGYIYIYIEKEAQISKPLAKKVSSR